MLLQVEEKGKGDLLGKDGIEILEAHRLCLHTKRHGHPDDIPEVGRVVDPSPQSLHPHRMDLLAESLKDPSDLGRVFEYLIGCRGFPLLPFGFRTRDCRFALRRRESAFRQERTQPLFLDRGHVLEGNPHPCRPLNLLQEKTGLGPSPSVNHLSKKDHGLPCPRIRQMDLQVLSRVRWTAGRQEKPSPADVFAHAPVRSLALLEQDRHLQASSLVQPLSGFIPAITRLSSLDENIQCEQNVRLER